MKANSKLHNHDPRREGFSSAAEISNGKNRSTKSLIYFAHNGSKKPADADYNVKGVIAPVGKNKLKSRWDYGKQNDEEIASEVLFAFKWKLNIPKDTVKITVVDGWISLAGVIENEYQRDAAEEAVANLLGVTGVSNNIMIKLPSV